MTQPTIERRLLLLACSQRKQPTPEPLPAIERYDGPMFRTLRKYLRQEPNSVPALDLMILSARYGLITGTTSTVVYDQRMTSSQAAALQPSVHAEMRRLFIDSVYSQLFISIGQEYAGAVTGVEHIIPSSCMMTFATGSHGQRQATLYRWLYKQPPPSQARTAPTTVIRLRGKTITLSAAEALNLAHQALALEQGDPTNFRYWYVMVDGQQVSAKWFVSQIVGLPTNAFGAEEARRVLTALGIEVRSL